MTASSLLDGLRSVRVLRDTMKAVRPDVAYFVPVPTIGGHVRDVAAVNVMRRHAGRVVGHVHSGNFAARALRFRSLPSVRYLLSSVDRFLVLSESLAAPLVRLLGTDRVIVVPNPIDDGVAFTRSAIEHRLAERPSDVPIRILYLSNFYRSKGYGALLDALESIGTTGAWTATFAGHWPSSEAQHQAAFMNRIARSMVSERLSFHGAVSSRSEIRGLLAAHDVLVLPSSYPLEAQPKAIIEAMNAGLAIVATTRGGIPDMLAHGRGGLLVPPGDPASLADAIRRTLDVSERIDLGRAARTVFEERFSRPAIEATFLDALFSA